MQRFCHAFVTWSSGLWMRPTQLNLKTHHVGHPNAAWAGRSRDIFVLLSQLKIPRLWNLRFRISYTPPIPHLFPPSSIPDLLRSILSISSRACYLVPSQQWARSTNRRGSVQTMDGFGGFGGAVEEVKRGSRRIWALFMVPRIGFDSMWKIFLLVYTLNIIQDRLQVSGVRSGRKGYNVATWTQSVTNRETFKSRTHPSIPRPPHPCLGVSLRWLIWSDSRRTLISISRYEK